jgi:selenide,water dikinase
VLLLTKAIGTGILATALKRGLLDKATLRKVTGSMAALNKEAAETMEKHIINACTDISGFGLLGHLLEMTRASGMNAEIQAAAVPVFPDVEGFAAAGIIPGGSQANLEHVADRVDWQDGISAIRKIILCDAQTSGGLLISVPERYAERMAEKMGAVPIGRIIGQGQGRVKVVSN